MVNYLLLFAGNNATPIPIRNELTFRILEKNNCLFIVPISDIYDILMTFQQSAKNENHDLEFNNMSFPGLKA